MSSPGSDSGTDELTVVDVTQVDDSICVLCRTSTYVGQTINCETCALWFHFGCVGVKPGDDVVEREDVPYYCPQCAPRPAGGRAPPPPASAPKRSRRPKKAARPPPATPPSRKRPPAKSAATSQAGPLASPPIKLKISFGSKATPSASVLAQSGRATPTSAHLDRRKSALSVEAPEPDAASESSRRRRRRKSQDEEEKWLDAVEAGNVSAVLDPELKSIKDPKLMTARQRAMVEKQKVEAGEIEIPDDESSFAEDDGHMALDYGYKKKEEDTEQSLKLKALKSQKRKVLEMVKRENDKQKTMDRLLKKKDSKAAAKQTKSVKSIHREAPKFSYHINRQGRFVSVPLHAEFPLAAQPPRDPPPTILCSVPNCGTPKKYNCAQSGQPLCSLSCYQANQRLIAT
eukprot:snap_masked-scaffold308_size214241-processed-gene-1.30 protein:Tk09070 transcript:snap_masked-scaffold308_size214241-processed-gene-1.30-mRNA-1 annotation:"ino80 complex subunit b"